MLVLPRSIHLYLCELVLRLKAGEAVSADDLQLLPHEMLVQGFSTPSAAKLGYAPTTMSFEEAFGLFEQILAELHYPSAAASEERWRQLQADDSERPPDPFETFWERVLAACPSFHEHYDDWFPFSHYYNAGRLAEHIVRLFNTDGEELQAVLAVLESTLRTDPRLTNLIGDGVLAGCTDWDLLDRSDEFEALLGPRTLREWKLIVADVRPRPSATGDPPAGD